MKTLLTIITLCVTWLAHGQTKPRVVEGLSMTSSVLGQEVKYSIILPEDYYVSKKTYPVVFLLHGLGDNESSWLEYGQVSQVVDAAVKRKEIVPMIYVMPQGFASYYVNDYAGKFRYEDMFIRELVPFIDQQYRTILDAAHRATLGYSMGGFGALVLPLRNPDVFSIAVPLSISVRTDAQYMYENASGWDEQWGRLFGAVGQTGEARLTDYYKQHSPFHILAQQDLNALKNLKLYIDNGDDEETLCRSNEELHGLLRDKKIPHEFRVRDGGHEFSYWREALPNALHFISDAMEAKPYRGDIKNFTVPANVASNVKLISQAQYDVLLPTEYAHTQRLYPVLYVSGKFSAADKSKIAAAIHAKIANGAAPFITVFIPETVQDINPVIIARVQQQYRVREGWRFRAWLGYGADASSAFSNVLVPEYYTACILLDVPIDLEKLKITYSTHKKQLERTWLMVVTTSNSRHGLSNGAAHVFLRDEEVYHEYRVQEGEADVSWLIQNLGTVLDFTLQKIHR